MPTVIGGATSISRDFHPRIFWGLQAAVWTAYGGVLMAPWIGRYTILSMIPNKVAIAGTGLLTSAALRLAYRALIDRGVGKERMIGVVCLASLFGGAVWSVTSAALVRGESLAVALSPGWLQGGVPHLGGPLYCALVMLTWSLAWFVLSGTRPAVVAVTGRVPPVAADSVSGANGCALSVLPDGRVAARDGARTIVLAGGDIGWVEADGDYVRLHARQGRLLVRATMGDAEAVLGSKGFVRIHRSSIVNVASVLEVKARSHAEMTVQLADGTKLKASRGYAPRLKQALGVGSGHDTNRH